MHTLIQNSPRNLARIVIPWLYIALALWGVILGFTRPNMNWDMICYVGSVNAWSGRDSQDIYDKSLGSLKETLPEWIYTDFTKNFLSATPKAYVQQLPFCQVKPLYNAAMWLLHQTGMALPIASWTVSTLSFALLSLLLFLWRPHYLARSVWLLMVLGLDYLWEWPMATLARFSTPDSLATLLIIATLLCWLYARSFSGFCLLGWLAMLTRPDAMIPIGAFAAYFALFAPAEYRIRWHASLFLIVLMLASYATVNHLAGSYPYEHFFIYSFIHLTPYPAEMTEHLTPAMYWGVFSGWFVVLIRLERFITLLLLSAAACWSYWKKPAPGNVLWLHLLGLAWACWTLRFILWPSALDERFYYSHCIIILLASGELIAPYAAEIWQRLRQPIHAPSPEARL